MNKVVVCIMGQNAEKFIGMCLESVKDADAIVYCDGGSTDDTLHIVGNFEYNKGERKLEHYHGTEPVYSQFMSTVKVIENEYNQEDKAMNGKQRNFYLKYLKENYKDWTCLCLDADEVLMDNGINIIREFIPQIIGFMSPQIHHFIGDLGHEDATRDKHYVPNRLFKVTDDLNYTEVEHSVLHGGSLSHYCNIEIWHLREVLGIFGSNKKHLNNKAKSNIHSSKYLDWWHKAMIFGYYPKKPVYYGAIPTPIKNYFDI